jgi:excinuclease ABC subunit C
MYDDAGLLLYVGKAKNLKKRVSQYFAINKEQRILAWIDKVDDVRLILTATETEALLLECNSIKTLSPKYNIDLRDDKSYPYLLISDHPEYPRISYERGTLKKKGTVFGPYPNAAAVRTTLELVQKLFQIRPCQDSFFKHRQRPCLQYQIKRCTAPCVGYVSSEDYQQQIKNAKLFLEGKNNEVLAELLKSMQVAATQQAFEQAALLRDQITKLRQLQENQIIVTEKGDLDVVSLSYQGKWACVYLLMIRSGRLLGGKPNYLSVPADVLPIDIVEAFMRQHYLDTIQRDIWPDEIILPLPDENWLVWQQVIQQKANKTVLLKSHVKAERAKWLLMAENNAIQSLQSRLSRHTQTQDRLEALAALIGLPLITRVLGFDISHLQGQATYGSCVAFNQEGPDKKNYRLCKIEHLPKGDDYAAMKENVSRIAHQIQNQELRAPDLIVIDGGKGQLSSAKEALLSADQGSIPLIGLAKGPARKAGLETIWYLSDEQLSEIDIPPYHPARHILQQIRDESHRFAIKHQRNKARKIQKSSPLDGIPGIGPKKQQMLLNYFGGLPALMQASQESIAKVSGIGPNLAELIFQALHKR